MDSLVKADLAKANSKAEEGALLSGVNGVLITLATHGLLREQRIEPEYVGVHWDNRDG